MRYIIHWKCSTGDCWTPESGGGFFDINEAYDYARLKYERGCKTIDGFAVRLQEVDPLSCKANRILVQYGD